MFASAQGVKHAPTFQACEADINLWTSQISGWPSPTDEQEQEATKSLTVREMNGRMGFVNECAGAHPIFEKARTGELPAAFSLVLIYDRVIRARLYAFLERHGLSNKFQGEDEAGKR